MAQGIGLKTDGDVSWRPARQREAEHVGAQDGAGDADVSTPVAVVTLDVHATAVRRLELSLQQK
jgi:hypothetical protein